MCGQRDGTAVHSGCGIGDSARFGELCGCATDGHAGQVISALDCEHSRGLMAQLSIGDLQNKVVVDLIASVERLGRGVRVVEAVGQLIGGQGQGGSAVGANAAVGQAAIAAAPAVGFQPGGVVVGGGVDIRAAEADHAAVGAGHRIGKAAGFHQGG